jgi:hypothetical protein
VVVAEDERDRVGGEEEGAERAVGCWRPTARQATSASGTRTAVQKATARTQAAAVAQLVG